MTLTVGIAGEDSEEECHIVLRPQEAALLARQKDIKVCAERDAGALVGFPQRILCKGRGGDRGRDGNLGRL